MSNINIKHNIINYYGSLRQRKRGGGGTVSVASPTPKKGLSGVLPSIEEQAEWYKECEDILTPMIDAGTATPVDIEATFARRALEYYVGGTPRNTALGSNVCCHGAGVHVTTYKVYKMEGAGAYHPDEFNRRYGHYPRLFMVDHGRTTRVGEMRGDKNHSLGRAGGLTGWDSTRDMFGFAMASFEHNFEALLGAFSSRPSLPCTDAWTLPNLVYSEEIERRERRFNCEIVEPAYAIPPASYSYSFMLPTPSMVLLVGTKCDQEVNTKCEVWNSDKKDIVEPFDVTFPEGESETRITVRAAPPSMLQKGFFNINPERPMCVSYVKTIPPR